MAPEQKFRWTRGNHKLQISKNYHNHTPFPIAAPIKNEQMKVDIIIWDKASMSSAWMLELVNTLHHSLSDQHDNG